MSYPVFFKCSNHCRKPPGHVLYSQNYFIYASISSQLYNWTLHGPGVIAGGGFPGAQPVAVGRILPRGDHGAVPGAGGLRTRRATGLGAKGPRGPGADGSTQGRT